MRRLAIAAASLLLAPPAFAEHLLPDSTFIGGNDQPIAGRDAIAKDWAGLIAGQGVVLQWYPEHVHVAGNGQVALSRGPYWMETTGEDGKRRYLAGRFISTWLRDADGTWHVAFDGGGGNVPKPVDAAEVARLVAGRKGCTAG